MPSSRSTHRRAAGCRGRALQVDYEAYARSHRVLPMPPGYSPVRPVVINSFVNYWIPTYRDTVLASLAGLLALGTAIVMLRRRRS